MENASPNLDFFWANAYTLTMRKANRDIDRQVGERIRLERKSRGMSQQQLANRLTHMGLPTAQVTISGWETGERGVNKEVARILGDCFGKPASWFVSLEEEEWEDDEAAMYFRELPEPARRMMRAVLRAAWESTRDEDALQALYNDYLNTVRRRQAASDRVVSVTKGKELFGDVPSENQQRELEGTVV